MKMKKILKPADEEIKAWEAEHGRLKHAVVKDPDTGEEIHFYFKKIDLNVLRLASRAISEDKDPIRYAEIVLKNTVLNNRELLDDSEVFLSLVPIVDKLLSRKVAELEKN